MSGAYFFFDTDDDELRLEDEVGVRLSGPEQARLMALDALPDMAREKMPNGNHRNFGVSVRDEDNDVIFVANLSLKADWLKKKTAGGRS